MSMCVHCGRKVFDFRDHMTRGGDEMPKGKPSKGTKKDKRLKRNKGK